MGMKKNKIYLKEIKKRIKSFLQKITNFRSSLLIKEVENSSRGNHMHKLCSLWIMSYE